jgi:CubicO group peptidase (beta-lactamase class C family)
MQSDLSTARSAGMDPDGLADLYRSIERDIAQERFDGAVFIVARHGDIVMHEAVGTSERKKARPARHDDVFHLMSISKQLSTIPVLRAIERGDLSLDTKVSDVIEGFGVKGKQNVTVFHLLTHTSGLNPELPAMIMPQQFLSIRALSQAAARERLFRRPGRGVSYNAMTAQALLSEMVCRLDARERSFPTILDEDVLKPLGMTDTSLVLRPDLRERRVPIVARYAREGLFDPKMLESMNAMFSEKAEFPAGGAIGTALDVLRFAEMLRRGGTNATTRVLSRETLALALQNHTGSHPNDIFDYAREMRGWPDFPAYIGLGFFLRGEGVFPTPMGHLASPQTYSGQGAGSTLFWVDPVRDVTFVCLTAGVMEDSDSILRFQRLSDLVLRAVH